MQVTDHRADRLFWGTIAFGLLVPVLVVELAAAVLVGSRSFGQAVADLPRILFAPGYGLFVIVLLTAIPFVVLAFVIRSEFRSRVNDIAEARTRSIARVVGAAAFVTGFVLAVQMGIWVKTYETGRGVSTAGIGLYLLPFEALLVLAVGYYVGGLAGWVVSRLRRQVSST
jgi:hypothetical protein